MNMKKNRIPKFKSEDEERDFWAAHDSAEYIDWSKAKNVTLSNLKPSVLTRIRDGNTSNLKPIKGDFQDV